MDNYVSDKSINEYEITQQLLNIICNNKELMTLNELKKLTSIWHKDIPLHHIWHLINDEKSSSGVGGDTLINTPITIPKCHVAIKKLARNSMIIRKKSSCSYKKTNVNTLLYT